MTTHLAHLRAAVKLLGMRGRSQFEDATSHAVYMRTRGLIVNNPAYTSHIKLTVAQITQCIQAKQDVPQWIRDFCEDDELMQKEFEPEMMRLLLRSARLIAKHKSLGYVDTGMAKEAYALMHDWPRWIPRSILRTWEFGQRPAAEELMGLTNGALLDRIMWLITGYMFKQCVLLFISEFTIEYNRSLERVQPGSAKEALDEAMRVQTKLCEEVKADVDYYMRTLHKCQSPSKGVAGHLLLWPPSILLSLSTASLDTFFWAADRAKKVAETFSFKPAEEVSAMIMMGAKAAPGYEEHIQSPAVRKQAENAWVTSLLA
jgi:hypothetical protein